MCFDAVAIWKPRIVPYFAGGDCSIWHRFWEPTDQALREPRAPSGNPEVQDREQARRQVGAWRR